MKRKDTTFYTCWRVKMLGEEDEEIMILSRNKTQKFHKKKVWKIRGPFEKFVDGRQCAAVTKSEVV
jgi:hypothetical protein